MQRWDVRYARYTEDGWPFGMAAFVRADEFTDIPQAIAAQERVSVDRIKVTYAAMA